MSPTLWRASVRSLLRDPWQLGLSVLGIALGVAVVVSIDLANRSALRAFTLSAEAVAGRATHRIVGGPAGLPEELYRTLVVDLGVRRAAPVVEGHVALPERSGRTLRLLGIDPFAEAPFRPYLSGGGEGLDVPVLLTEPGAVLLSAGTAASLDLSPGDTLRVRASGERRSLVVAGLLRPADALSRQALRGLLIADIATAQALLDRVGRLTRIDLRVGDGADALLARIRGALPAGATIVPAGTERHALEQMTRAFRLNLTALSLLALVFGAFLIYNSTTFSVVRRRELIGTLRAVGVTRREVFGLLIAEALAVGALGTGVGLAGGVALGRELVRLVARTINDLYFTVSVTGLAVPPLALAKGAALGLGATLVAALVPAREATMAPPRASLSRSVIEGRLRRLVPRTAVVGIGLVALAAALFLVPTKNLVVSFAGFLALMLGAALIVPRLTVALLGAARPLLRRAFGLVGGMAARGVTTALSRTAPAIAALVVAVAVTVGLGIMITSFRGTVVDWLEATLQADVYVSLPRTQARTGATLDPALVERLASTRGIAGVSTYRGARIGSPKGPVELIALGLDPRGRDSFQFKAGEPAEVWPAFARGAVLVSEPFAYHRGLEVGSPVRLRTARGVRAFPVAGVFYDYSSSRGVVMMSRETYKRFWRDAGVSSLAIFAGGGVEVDRLVARLRERAAGHAPVRIRSNRALRRASLEIFDRTFRITGVLRLLAGAVAFIGILSALMALQLERGRELGVMRATGMTPGQVGRLTVAQTGLMGLLAGLLAIPLGLVLAVVMVFVINRRSFGWTMEMQVAPEVLLQAVLLALVGALLAGLYPAWRMARTPPARALREE